MATAMRAIALVVCPMAAAGLMACGTGGVNPPDAGPTVSEGPRGSDTSSPAATRGATPPTTPVAFTVTEGKEHDACGIGLTVRVVPPSANGRTDGQAFLVGGPVGHVLDASGDQPAPSNVAPARPAATVTVVGQRFRVDSVDVTNGRVRLEALC